MAEVLFRAKLVRDGSSTPWGFRLQGGVEYDKPLTLLKVVEDSLAAKGGLHPGDIVVKLAGKSAEDMTHKDAQEAIISAGNALEIIVERAEVTMTTIATPTTPTAGGCDVKTSTNIAHTTEPTVSNASAKVSERDRSENAIPDEAEKPSSKTSQRQHSVQPATDNDNDRTTDYVDDRRAGDQVVVVDGEMPAHRDSSLPVNDAANREDAERCSTLSKALENDKIGKEPANVIHIKQKETTNSGLRATLADHVPSKHKRTQSLDNNDSSDTGQTASERRQDLDSEHQKAGQVADDAAVIVQVCDNDQEAAKTSPNDVVIECVDSKHNTPDGPAEGGANLSSAVRLEPSSTSLTADRSCDHSVSSRETEGIVGGYSSATEFSRDGQRSPTHVPENGDRSKEKEVPLVDGTLSILPKDPVADTTDWSAPSQLSTPSVINQFQSPATDVTSQSETIVAQAMPSCSSSLTEGSLPESSLRTSHATELASQAPHIPHSSPSTLITTTTTESAPNNIPISLVVTDLPSVTTEARIIDFEKAPPEQNLATPTQPIVVASVPDLKSATYATGDITPPSAVSVPIRIQQQESPAPSRQTKAPAEEIIIASKPSLQIVTTTTEHRETIRIPAGDKRREQRATEQRAIEPRGEQQDDAVVTAVSHEKKDFSKTAPWRVHKQTAAASGTSSSSSPIAIEKNVLHPWRKSRAEHAMSHSLDDRQLSAAASRLTEVGGIGTGKATLREQVNATSPEASQKKPQSTLTYVGKRIESPPISSPVSASTESAAFFKMASVLTAPLPAGIKVRQPSPTNPMAYQRSASPQGVAHYGASTSSQQPSVQQTSRSTGMHYQQTTGPHGGTIQHQPASPREVSPVGYQQPPRLQTGSSLTYRRSVSPQGNMSLMVPQQSSPYPSQPSPVLSPQPRLLRPQPPPPTLQPHGYAVQQPQFPQPSPRLSSRPHAAVSPVPAQQRSPMAADVQLTGKPSAAAAAQAMVGGQATGLVAPASATPYQLMSESQMIGPRPPGLFALFDKRFTEKFLQWSEERPGDLCRSETYKLVHEMDEKSEDL